MTRQQRRAWWLGYADGRMTQALSDRVEFSRLLWALSAPARQQAFELALAQFPQDPQALVYDWLEWEQGEHLLLCLPAARPGVIPQKIEHAGTATTA